MKKPKFKACYRCGKGWGIIHTCNPKWIDKNLLNTVKTYNKDVTKHWWNYAEEYIYLNIQKWQEEIRLDLFIKHFLNKWFIGSCQINYNLWFIILNEEIYLWELDLLLIDKLNINFNDYIKYYYYLVDNKDINKIEADTLELYEKQYYVYKRRNKIDKINRIY